MLALLLSLMVVCIFFVGYFIGHIRGYQEATDIAIKELNKVYKEIEEGKFNC